MTAAAIPSVTTTTSAPVSASSSSVNIELVTPYNPNTQTNLARQVMCLGDPENGNMIADVIGNRSPGVNDNALVTMLKAGSPDIQTTNELLASILLELKQLNANLGSAPTTDSY